MVNSINTDLCIQNFNITVWGVGVMSVVYLSASQLTFASKFSDIILVMGNKDISKYKDFPVNSPHEAAANIYSI